MPADVIIDPTNGQIYWNDGTGSPQSISIKGDALNAISFVGYSGSYSPGSSPTVTNTLVTVNDNSGTDALVPGTSGFNLGSSTLRWNTFATNANLSGTLVVSDATISSSLLTGSVRFNGGIAISGNASIGQSLNFYNPAATFYTGFKAGAVTSNTLYTLPLTYPGAGTSVLQSDTSGNLSWVVMSATSSSGGTVASGTQYQLAGYYSGTGASVSGSSTLLNNTAIGQVQIAHTTASFGTSSGALQVAGGVGISGRLSFNQASFGTTGISTLPTMAMIGQTGDPIYMSVLEDNSISFEGSQGQLFSISPNLTTGYIWAVNDISGVPFLRSSVGGTIGIAEFGGVVGIGQTNPIYKLDLKGSFGLASSNDSAYNFIFSNSAASGSNSLQIRSANSILFYNSGNSFYTGFKSAATSNVTFTLPPDAGSSGQFLQTNGSGTLTWATATGGGGGSGATGVNPGGQYQIGYYASTGASIDGSSTFTNNTSTNVVNISHSTASTSTATGALTVTGGVGIGGSLYVGGTGSSISGVRIASGAITAGAWNGTVIATQYGGTGQNLSSSSGILTISSGTVSASTTSSAILNALSDETGSGSLVFATSPALVTPNIGAATGTSLYLSAVSPSTSVNTGAVIVPGGVGIGQSLSVGGYLQLFNTNNYTSFVSASTASTVYTLPPTSPATGSSVLQSTSAGVMSWVPMVASGGAGSGTVAIPDAQFRLAFYAGTGASVSSTSLITAVGTGVTILGATNASSTTAAALSVTGGLGVGGNAFIGGTIYAPSTSTSSISGINFANGIVTSGTWSGSTITAFYGGTGLQGPAAIGDLIVANTTSTWSRLTVGTTSGHVLTSNGSNSLPTWQAVPPAAASSVAVTPTTLNQSFFITTVSASNGSGLGLSTITSFVVNPSTHIVSISGLAVTNNTASTSTATGALIVSGGFGLAGNAFIGGTIYAPSSTASNFSNLLVSNNTATTSTTSGALVVNGGLGLGGNAFIGGTVYVPSSTASNFSNLLVSNNTATTSTTSGALIVSGGLGLAGNAFIGGTIYAPSTSVNSISGINFANGIITSGAWSATAITAFYGGTGLQSPFVVGDILYATTTSTWGRLAASSTSGQVLTSNGAGVLPTWQAVPPAAASSVAVTPTTLNQSFFITTVSSSNGSGLGLSTITSFVVNPSTNIVSLSGLAVTALTQSTSSSTGALIVSGGAGIGYSLSVGGMIRVGSNTFTKNYSLGDVSLDNGSSADTPAVTYYYANNRNFGHDVFSSGAGSTRWRLVKEINESGGAELFSIDTTGAIQIYSAGNYSGFRFTGTGQTIYTLPSQSPQSAVGTSVLASTIEGVMRWVGMSGGSGSPGGSNKQIQYNNSNTFGGASGFEYTTGGIAVTVSVFAPSGTGYTAGMWVHAINGTTTRVGIGLSNPAFELEINGEISATNKSFVIDHPTKSGMKLRYGSLEGPENGVYVRGELKGTNIIEVPDHWIGLVHPDSYTVHLTPIGRFAHLYVEKIENYNVHIADNFMSPIHCYYSVWAERKDIPKLVTEYEAQ